MNDIVESPFGGERRNLAETAGARQDQSRELAETQTQYLMAQQFPRDPVRAMDRILNAFTRTTLAEKSQYQFARGGTDIRGASIKAMEAIATEWGNVESAWRERSRGIGPDGVPYSEVEAVAVDLQNRTRKRIAFIVRHWRDTRQGGYVLKDERDVYELCANQAQRRVRACLEAIIPGDVVDAAMAQADATLRAKADTSAEAMTKMVAAFAEFGVTKEQIEARIQRRLDSITPAQVVSLKRIYASLRDEMSEASEWFDKGEGEADAAAGSDGNAPSGGGSGTAGVKNRMKAKKNAPGKAAPEVTYAQVADALNAATTPDAINEAADLIRQVKDAGQRTELEALYASRMGEFAEDS
ncbi:hypothetical protein [Paraburkholderia silvatlantica]|uniref:hypothetical protein n=1 Tax=Paraburkholderia silvatlantica TaxID=321895 RepID=UPI0037531591